MNECDGYNSIQFCVQIIDYVWELRSLHSHVKVSFFNCQPHKIMLAKWFDSTNNNRFRARLFKWTYIRWLSLVWVVVNIILITSLFSVTNHPVPYIFMKFRRLYHLVVYFWSLLYFQISESVNRMTEQDVERIKARIESIYFDWETC